MATSLSHVERQLELADLELVTGGELRRFHPLSIHVRPVQASHVVDEELAVVPPELRVPSRHGDVVQEDVALGMPSRRRDVLVDQELGAGVGPTLY